MAVLARRSHDQQIRRDQARSVTMSVRQLKALPAEPMDIEDVRPARRADCIGVKRPCSWAGCRYNLALDVNPINGSIKFNFPLGGMIESCALDVADTGVNSLDAVGQLINLTREGTRLLANKALIKLVPGFADVGIDAVHIQPDTQTLQETADYE